MAFTLSSLVNLGNGSNWRMEENIKNELLQYLRGGKDFILSQAPEVVKQILHYDYIYNLIFLVLSSLGLIIGITTFIYCFKSYRAHALLDKYAMPILQYFLCLGFALLALISIGTIIDCATTILKIKTAPKYYLISKLKD